MAARRSPGATSSPLALHARDLGDDVLDRGVDRLDTGGGQVREVGCRGRSRDLGLHDLGPDGLERVAGAADLVLLDAEVLAA